MKKNTGVSSEQIFDAAMTKAGAYVYKFEDAKALYGKNKKAVANDPKPCDRLVVLNGVTYWCEIKSTNDSERFAFDLIKKSQLGYARSVINKGGPYFFYVHSLTHNQWFRIPAAMVLHRILNTEKRSFRWEELKHQRIELGTSSDAANPV